ncbi:MAG TPA: AraC family transcriptional regulator [Pseudobacteroides sp.]|uniref:AraC family transcriptional regulator n=1 Tax=Pseudobacteroides sp. TaxID=1968840 RepID=UPI002F93A830
MKLPRQHFTLRQHMKTNDFELFHYNDSIPVEVDFHNHDFYEIYLFLSGSVTYVIEGKSYRLRPKDILIINNKELHKAFINEGVPYERIVIWINPQYIKSLCSEKTNLFEAFDSSSVNKHNLLRLTPDASEFIYSIVEKLGLACSSIAFGNDILKTSYLMELLIYLNRAFQLPIGKETQLDITCNDKINNIIQYINNNLNGDVSLETLSSRFFLSKYHLLREFKKNTGYTVHRYIQQKRLIIARELLKDNKLVTDVCSQCGFGDYSNFIRAFRKEFGISPKKYSKKLHY